MDALAAARGSEPSARARSRAIPGDLQLAVLVLALCAFDASVNLVAETALYGPTFDWVPRLLGLLQSSLLCIVPGALAARLVFPRYPASHRECLGIVAVFLLGSAIGHWPGFMLISKTPAGHFAPQLPLALLAQSMLGYALGATGIVYAMFWWRRDTNARLGWRRDVARRGA